MQDEEWKEEYLKRFLGMIADYDQEKELFAFIEALLQKERSAMRDKAIACVPEKKPERYVDVILAADWKIGKA